MLFQYGDFSHGANECWLTSFQRSPVFTPRGFIRSYRDTVSFSGQIYGNQSALSTALQARATAYSVQGKDFKILDNSNGATPLQLISADSMGGTFVTGPINLRQVTGAMYATYLTYDVQVSAEFAAPEAGALVLDFQETLTFTGGIPVVVFLQCINTPPVRQVTSPQTPYQVVQTGFLKSLSQDITPMASLWPTAVVEQQTTAASPKIQRGVPVEWTVSWSYVHRSVDALVGSPNIL